MRCSNPVFLFIFIDSRNPYFLFVKITKHVFIWAHSLSYGASPMFHVLSFLTLQRHCVEPALWLTPFSNASTPRLHPGTRFCASQQYFSHHNSYWMSGVEGFSSDNLNTTRAIYEPILRIWNLLVPYLPWQPRHLNVYIHCWNLLNLSPLKTELQKSEW